MVFILTPSHPLSSKKCIANLYDCLISESHKSGAKLPMFFLHLTAAYNFTGKLAWFGANQPQHGYLKRRVSKNE